MRRGGDDEMGRRCGGDGMGREKVVCQTSSRKNRGGENITSSNMFPRMFGPNMFGLETKMFLRQMVKTPSSEWVCAYLRYSSIFRSHPSSSSSPAAAVTPELASSAMRN